MIKSTTTPSPPEILLDPTLVYKFRKIVDKIDKIFCTI